MREVPVRRVVFQRAPEAMARAAGTAYRLFAGTDSLNVGLTASHTGLASLDALAPQVHTSSTPHPTLTTTRHNTTLATIQHSLIHNTQTY